MAIEVNTTLLEDLGLRRDLAPKRERLGQEDFLRLMVAQLRNQNPLQPMENGEFLTQIAQFGTVSGVRELNAAFERLTESLYSNQALQAASLVGRRVLVAGSEAYLPEGGEVALAAELPAASPQVRAVIRDSLGRTVREIDLGGRPAGLVELRWDGLTGEGEPAPAGRYTVSVEALLDGQATALETYVGARVESVTLDRGGRGLALNLQGLGSVDLGEVRRIG